LSARKNPEAASAADGSERNERMPAEKFRAVPLPLCVPSSFVSSPPPEEQGLARLDAQVTWMQFHPMIDDDFGCISSESAVYFGLSYLETKWLHHCIFRTKSKPLCACRSAYFRQLKRIDGEREKTAWTAA
jgi:hypothetical protein